MTISDDGNCLYAADLGDDGLRILDVSQVQQRAVNPQVTEVSSLTWDVVTIPQQPMPVTIKGRPYLVKVDEFTRNDVTGAARIIDISDERNPFVVSNLRLEVNQQENRHLLVDDPGYGSSLSDYSAHYCAVPQRKEPGIVACSFVLSGLRVFDIRDPESPVEIAYFNPSVGDAQSYAMSAPAFAPERCEIWYSDGNKASGASASRAADGQARTGHSRLPPLRHPWKGQESVNQRWAVFATSRSRAGESGSNFPRFAVHIRGTVREVHPHLARTRAAPYRCCVRIPIDRSGGADGTP